MAPSRGRKIGMDKVFKMIGALVATLQTEQHDDEHTEEYCLAQLDEAGADVIGIQESRRLFDLVVRSGQRFRWS